MEVTAMLDLYDFIAWVLGYGEYGGGG